MARYQEGEMVPWTGDREGRLETYLGHSLLEIVIGRWSFQQHLLENIKENTTFLVCANGLPPHSSHSLHKHLQSAINIETMARAFSELSDNSLVLQMQLTTRRAW